MEQTKLAAALAIFLVSYVALYVLIGLNIGGLATLALALALLYASGQVLERIIPLERYSVFHLIRSTKFLEVFDLLASKFSTVSIMLADLGLVVAYGLFSYPLLRGAYGRKARLVLFVSGFLVQTTILAFMLPAVFSLIFIVLPSVNVPAQKVAAIPGDGISQYLVLLPFLASYVIGLGGLTLFSLLTYGFGILASVAGSVGGSGAQLCQIAPGATLIIPGINLPFVEGILALIIIMVVHEGAHSVLARVLKVPVTSAGVVLLGTIPVGAFVDPDEAKLGLLSALDQARILVAGSMSNLLTAFVALLLLAGFLLGTKDYRAGVVITEPFSNPCANSTNTPSITNNTNTTNPTTTTSINSSLSNQSQPPPQMLSRGLVITKINGTSIDDLESLIFKPGENVSLETANGTMLSVVADSYGRIHGSLAPYRLITSSGVGVIVYSYSLGTVVKGPAQFLFYYPGWLGNFLLNVLGLTLVLNFIIATVNLLPVPMFDGHRIVSHVVNHKQAMTAISLIVVLAFLVNFLPWLFK